MIKQCALINSGETECMNYASGMQIYDGVYWCFDGIREHEPACVLGALTLWVKSAAGLALIVAHAQTEIHTKISLLAHVSYGLVKHE